MTHPLEPTLAVVTGDIVPELSDDGQKLAAALSRRGIDVEPVLWRTDSIDWGNYDAVLIRSCWDYPENVRRFQALLDELDRAEVPVCNPLPALRWNLHKSYLTTLGDAGVQVPSTIIIEAGSNISLEAVLAEQAWNEAVVKPAVGTMSADVSRISRDEAARSADLFTELVAQQDVLVQEFAPEVTRGERSLVFFGGSYSHGWRSIPGQDFSDVATYDREYEPPAPLKEQASAVLHTATNILDIDPSDLPYARVDCVQRNTDLLLMELELIEPYLGFESGENTVERFCDALTAYLRPKWGAK